MDIDSYEDRLPFETEESRVYSTLVNQYQQDSYGGRHVEKQVTLSASSISRGNLTQ